MTAKPANVVTSKTEQMTTQTELQDSSDAPATAVTSANVVQAEEEPKQLVIQRQENASSQSKTPIMIWAHELDAEAQVRAEIRQREAEVLQLKEENQGLLGMLMEAQNIQSHDNREIEELKNLIIFLENKNKNLQQQSNGLQADKQVAVEKTKEMDGKIRLIEHISIPVKELNGQMKDHIKTLQSEKK